MTGHRIHIFGASGVGASTLGRALATALASQHFDTDDFYWYPSDPPFQDKRPIPDRVALMEQVFLPRRDWVLSGSVDSWSAGIDHRFTHVVFLELDPEERADRLRAREQRRLDLAGGGSDTEREEVESFLEWAKGYEDGLLPGRNRARHLAWIDELTCPVLWLRSEPPMAEQVAQILQALDADPARP